MWSWAAWVRSTISAVSSPNAAQIGPQGDWRRRRHLKQYRSAMVTSREVGARAAAATRMDGQVGRAGKSPAPTQCVGKQPRGRQKAPGGITKTPHGEA